MNIKRSNAQSYLPEPTRWNQRGEGPALPDIHKLSIPPESPAILALMPPRIDLIGITLGKLSHYIEDSAFGGHHRYQNSLDCDPLVFPLWNHLIAKEDGVREQVTNVEHELSKRRRSVLTALSVCRRQKLEQLSPILDCQARERDCATPFLMLQQGLHDLSNLVPLCESFWSVPHCNPPFVETSNELPV